MHKNAAAPFVLRKVKKVLTFKEGHAIIGKLTNGKDLQYKILSMLAIKKQKKLLTDGERCDILL